MKVCENISISSCNCFHVTYFGRVRFIKYNFKIIHDENYDLKMRPTNMT